MNRHEIEQWNEEIRRSREEYYVNPQSGNNASDKAPLYNPKAFVLGDRWYRGMKPSEALKTALEAVEAWRNDVFRLNRLNWYLYREIVRLEQELQEVKHGQEKAEQDEG